MQRAIEALTHDKTIIMIAHRLKTVRNATRSLCWTTLTLSSAALMQS